MSRFLSQVENFFSRRDFYRKSKFFFPVENFFISRYFHSCRDFCFFKSRFLFMSRSFNSSRHFSIQGDSRDVRQRLHEGGFICNRIVSDAVTPSVYTTPIETVAETGSI